MGGWSMLKQKVLIVDDDENIAELIALYLEKEQYDTETAADCQADWWLSLNGPVRKIQNSL